MLASGDSSDQIFAVNFEKEVGAYLEPHHHARTLHERRMRRLTGERPLPVTSICTQAPPNKRNSASVDQGQLPFEDGRYSNITDTLDGIFGFAPDESKGPNFDGMTRKKNEFIYKHNDREIAHDVFEDGTPSATVAFERLSKILRDKAYCRFKNLRDCFRLVDLNKSGKISRVEMHDFFSQFNLNHTDADMFFESLDPDPVLDQISYHHFLREFTNLIQPGVYNNDVEVSKNLVYGSGWLRKLG